MQVPKRRYDKIAAKIDPRMTEDKYSELKNRLDYLLSKSRPKAIAEVSRLAELGDFSENAEYQIAKGRLRGINARINELEDLLKRAEIIRSPANCERVAIGHQVTVERDGRLATYQLLGSSESDPLAGVISHASPVGQALLGKRVGDKVMVETTRGKNCYKIIGIK